jgi:hypothetical protein
VILKALDVEELEVKGDSEEPEDIGAPVGPIETLREV